jgi:hypothetical protein
MVYMQDITCSVCGKQTQESVGAGRVATFVCSECHSKEVAKKRREHFAKLDAMFIEDRIRRIEKWIYDYKPPRSVNDVRY